MKRSSKDLLQLKIHTLKKCHLGGGGQLKKIHDFKKYFKKYHFKNTSKKCPKNVLSKLSPNLYLQK